MNALWIVGIAFVVLIGGLLAGVTGLLFAPIVGLLLIIAIVVWMLARKAEGKPPVQ